MGCVHDCMRGVAIFLLVVVVLSNLSACLVLLIPWLRWSHLTFFMVYVLLIPCFYRLICVRFMLFVMFRFMLRYTTLIYFWIKQQTAYLILAKGKRFNITSFFQVLDVKAYESRQSYYASKGQKHFYFMTLNGGEVCLFWLPVITVCPPTLFSYFLLYQMLTLHFQPLTVLLF
jgi:hypothetical protein